MRVLNIEEYAAVEGARWAVTLAKKDGAPSKVPLVETEQPNYNIGDSLPFEVTLIKPDKGNWYYKRKGTPSQVSSPKEATRKPYRSPEESNAIERQVDKKVAAELYGYHMEKGTPFNAVLYNEIYKVVHQIEH